MSHEQVIRSFYNAINTHNLDKFTSFFSTDGQFTDMSSGRVFRGAKEIHLMAEEWLKTFSDMKLEVTSIIESGDNCCVELSLVGTHTGALRGAQGSIPASGKKVNVPSCDLIRMKNGKIKSLNCYIEATVMLDQIGAMEAQKAA